VSGLDKVEIDVIIAEEMEHLCVLEKALASD